MSKWNVWLLLITLTACDFLGKEEGGGSGGGGDSAGESSSGGSAPEEAPRGVARTLATTRSVPSVPLSYFQPNGPIVNLDLASAYASSTGEYSVLKDVALQSDGKAVMVGWVRGDSGPDWDPLVMRLHSDGELDQGFGQEGVVRFDFSGDMDPLRKVLVDRQDRIVVMGDGTSPSGRRQVFIYRLDTEGEVEVGPLWVDVPHSNYDKVKDLALDGDGNVWFLVQGGDAYLGKLCPRGLVSSLTVLPTPGIANYHAMGLDLVGEEVWVSTAHTLAHGADFSVFRMNRDLGYLGRMGVNLLGGQTRQVAVAKVEQGSLWVGGVHYYADRSKTYGYKTYNAPFAARISMSGELIWFREFDAGSRFDEITDLVVDDQSRVTLVGSTHARCADAYATEDYLLIRFLEDGGHDDSLQNYKEPFRDNVLPIARVNHGENLDDRAGAGVVLPTGEILVVGSSLKRLYDPETTSYTVDSQVSWVRFY